MNRRERPSGFWWRNHRQSFSLRSRGGQLEGPCPNCGGDNRFWVKIPSGLLGCRGCNPETDKEAFKRIIAACKERGWENGKAPLSASKPRKPSRPTSSPPNHTAMNDSAAPGGDIAVNAPERRWQYANTKGQTFDVVRQGDGARKKISRDPAGIKGPYLPLGEPADETVIVEGETCRDALIAAGLPAMTWCGGASAWRRTDWAALKGRHVILWPDNDSSGRAAMGGLGQHLHNQGCKVSMINSPAGTPVSWDAADATLTQIRELVEDAGVWEAPAQSDEDDLDEDDLDEAFRRKINWRQLTLDDLVNYPDPPPEILPGMPCGEFGVLAAAPKSGKSFLAALMGLAVATGRGLTNELAPDNQKGLPVLFCTFEEGQVRLLRRLAAAAEHYGLINDPGIANFRFSARGDNSWAPVSGVDDVPDAVAAIRREIVASGARFAILDPLSQLGSRKATRSYMPSAQPWGLWRKSCIAAFWSFTTAASILPDNLRTP